MTSEIKDQLIALFQEMYELTEPECCGSCRLPRSCCSPEYCEMAMEYAKEWDVDLKPLITNHPTLKFLGESGCVVQPHLRPLCTFHTCDINGFGFKMHPAPDPEWDKRYFELRDKIEQLMWELEG